MMKRTTMLLALVGLLLLSGVALAMSSPHYTLDWYTPLTGTGAAASSAHYAVALTVGQSAIGTSSSTNHEGCLGYWCGLAVEQHFYLPLMSKRHH